MPRLVALTGLLMSALALQACTCEQDVCKCIDTSADTGGDTGEDPGPQVFDLSSEAWEDRGWIPEEYTCDGLDHSPPLAWVVPPEGTESWVIQLVDPDADDARHWTVGGLPAQTLSLPSGASPGGALPQDAWELLNSFGTAAYKGPCPVGEHTYVFTLYALDQAVEAPSSAEELASLLGPYTLATTTLRGRYAGGE